ncbi:MAG: peptidoglycan bridge formation glycyltransferase FemA/FemB family protein [Candidatus Levybacteria bacterium]|nr:peptidoglycan bridge formation glycyltransferase FemA/FemB family protein [Candidatus Levybacteria bacterium]
MYRIEEITDKNTWENFLLSEKVPTHPFFQSWSWGQVQKALGHEIHRFGFYKKKDLLGVCLAVVVRARRGCYLHLRHGPLLSDFPNQFDSFLSQITPIAKRLRVDFIRLSPQLEPDEVSIALLKKHGLRNAPVHNMDAENSLVLDVTESDETLFSNMRKSTRYLVRKAKNMPIEITKTVSDPDLSAFLNLYRITSKRHKFVPHRGMKEELAIFGADNQALLFLAKYEKKIIAGALVIFYGKQAVYHHAASDDIYRDIPAPYLLQWEIIQEAKRRGMSEYNFWGVVPENKPKHPWQGLTMFKTGFGGKRVNYIHAQDLPLSTSYWKTHMIETLWRIRRGY